MISRKIPMTAALVCATMALHGLAHAGAPTGLSQPGEHPAERVSSGVLVRAPSLSRRSGLRLASLQALGQASRAGAQPQRSPGLSWTLLQRPPRNWTQGQPIDLSVGLGPSNPRYGGVRGGPSLVDEAVTSTTSTTGATGWTRPLGMRLSIRW